MSIKNLPKGFWEWATQTVGIKTMEPYQDERLKKCYECSNGAEVCPVCNCILLFKTKVKEETCPKGLWQ